MTEYPEINVYNPIKNSTFTPSIDKLSNRKKINGFLKDGSPKILNHYSKTDIMVYGALTRSIRDESNLFPKIGTIARQAACHYGSAQRSLAKFEKDLVLFSKETGRAKKYYFVPLNDDGTPDENSGEYQFAKSLQSSKKLDQIKQIARSDLAKSYISYKEQDSIQLDSVRKQLEPPAETPPKKHQKIPSKKAPATADCLKKIRAKIPKKANPHLGNTILIRGLNMHGLDYMLWLADECSNKPNPTKYFCKGINKREDFNKYDRKIVREGEAQAAFEHEQHKQDLKAMIEHIGERL